MADETTASAVSEETIVPTSLENQIADILDDSPNEVLLQVDEPLVAEKKEENITEGSKEDAGDISKETESASIEGTTVTTTPTTESGSEVDGLKAQIAALTEQINKLATPAPVATTPAPEIDLGINELMESMDFDKVMESKESFVTFLSNAFKAVSKATLGQAQEVVPQVITQQKAMEQVRQDFYKSYPELDAVKPYVAQVANTIATDHPEWQVAQVLAEAAKVSKIALGIPDVVVPTAPTKEVSPKEPTLPGGSGGTRKPAVQKGKLQSEIDDFLTD